MKTPTSLFHTYRIAFIRERVNSIIVMYGVQKGPELINQALANLQKIQWGRGEKFPAELDEDRWWMDQLLVGEAEDVRHYGCLASSLAYRYLRKKRTH